MRNTILGMIQSAKASYQSTILLATSRMSEVEALADRIAVMIHGGLHFIGTEQQLRKRHCKKIQIYLKMKPAHCQRMTYPVEIRKAMASAIPLIRPRNVHNYFIQYYIRQSKDEPLAWSSIFEHLEALRAQFDLESYTITFFNLEQLFTAYMHKYADNGDNTVTTTRFHRASITSD